MVEMDRFFSMFPGGENKAYGNNIYACNIKGLTLSIYENDVSMYCRIQTKSSDFETK